LKERNRDIAIIFYVLDQIFEQCKEDDLGGFLGAISPELCKDAQPMDRAIVKEWMKFNDVERVSKENIIKKAYDFLDYYEKRFGYNFIQAKIELMKDIKDKGIVDKAYELSQIMYEKNILMRQLGK